MRHFRFYISDGKEATGAGCLLTMLSAVVTIVFCLAFGPRVVTWVTPAVPWLGRKITLIIACGALLWPGALLFWAGDRILKRRGIPTSRDLRNDGDRESRPDA